MPRSRLLYSVVSNFHCYKKTTTTDAMELVKSRILRMNASFFFPADIFTDPPGPAAPDPTGAVSAAASSEVTHSEGGVLPKGSWLRGEGGMIRLTTKKLVIRLFLWVGFHGAWASPVLGRPDTGGPSAARAWCAQRGPREVLAP